MPGLAAERQDDLIITRGAPSAVARSAQRRCVAGELARLAPGLYVSDRDPQAQAALVREHWVRILGELVPGAIVSYRSAYGAAPAEGVLILSHPSRFNRTIRLPGLRVALVKGPGALPGDAPLGHGALHLASMQRMLLENLTRPRGAEHEPGAGSAGTPDRRAALASGGFRERGRCYRHGCWRSRSGLRRDAAGACAPPQAAALAALGGRRHWAA